MINFPKLNNPITIYLGRSNSERFIFINANEHLPLTPGVMFGGDYYGFRLIIDTGKMIIENTYKTTNKIKGVGIENRALKIFEEDKKGCWVFNLKGKLINSLPEIKEFVNESDEEILYNPINLVIDYTMSLKSRYSLFSSNNYVASVKVINTDKENVMLSSSITENIHEETKMTKIDDAIVFGGNSYGFNLRLITVGNEQSVNIPTSKRIYGLEILKDENIIKIYEDGKNGNIHKIDFSNDTYEIYTLSEGPKLKKRLGVK